MKATLLIFSCFFLHVASAQPINIEGRWYGASSFMKEPIRLVYDLKQEGTKVTGTTVSYSGKDSVSARVEGQIKGIKIVLKATTLLYKTGGTCMADSELVLKQSRDQKMLVGRWKGNAKFNTCPPLISGPISLMPEVKQSPVVYTPVEKPVTQEILDGDKEGQSLIRVLSKRKYHALIIGINKYADEGIEDLENPLSDAEQLAGVLTYHYSFDQGNVTLLENPTREEIITVLDQLTVEVTAKDNLLIFYAGHGIWSEQLNQGYWLPSDAKMNVKSRWLSNSTLRDYIGGIKSKHTLLISDACFSGGILKERAVFENGRAMLEMFKLPSRKAMTSGTMKTVPDKSVFIKYLLQNLINNQSPLLSADMLFRNFKTAVINNSPNGQVPQYGPITLTGDEGGDFIFLKRPQEQALPKNEGL